MTVDEVFKLVQFWAKKSQAGGNPTPDQFNLALWRGYFEWIMEGYGNREEYTPGNPIPRISWQNTQKITDDLRFLLVTHPLFLPSDGQLPIPDGTYNDLNGDVAESYLHHSALSFTVNKQKDGKIVSSKPVPITVVRDGELAHRLSSEIVQPTRRYPIAAYFSDYIQIYPKNLAWVQFSYLKEPVKPVWAYDLVNGRPVYDDSASVQLESPDETHNAIAIKVLKYLGISIREEQLIQWAERQETQGI